MQHSYLHCQSHHELRGEQNNSGGSDCKRRDDEGKDDDDCDGWKGEKQKSRDGINRVHGRGNVPTNFGPHTIHRFAELVGRRLVYRGLSPSEEVDGQFTFSVPSVEESEEEEEVH